MHRKSSTAMERIVALRSMIVAVVGYVMYLRRVIDHVTRRPAATAALAYASLLVLGLVAGTTGALVSRESPTVPDVAVAGAGDRLAAAERADRSARDEAPPADPAAAVAPPAPPPAWVSPMAGVGISSCFGRRWGAMHQGMDFAGEEGTPIVAVGAGTVFGVGWLYAGYGISVVIDHGNGIFTHYAHASATNVAVGQAVAPGEVIAWEGNTGDSSGPHLHFEVHQGLWSQIDPGQFLRERDVPIGC